MLDLAISKHEIGLGGRAILTLVKRKRTQALPWNRLRVGAPVVLTGSDGEERQNGLVCGRGHNSIDIVVDSRPEGGRFRIDLAADDVTRKRQKAAMRIAETASGNLARLREVLLGRREPQFETAPDISFFDSLNASQQQAVQFALAAEDVAIIHGPPGTGKTTTVVELIRQAVARGEKVLACAPSNTAVDNLLLKLSEAGVKVIRLGHPARVGEDLRSLTLDAQAASHGLMEIVRDMRREAEGLFRKIHRYTRARPVAGEKGSMHNEAKRLQADARTLEKQSVESVLDGADVICATVTFNGDLLGDRRFGYVVIDEACQSIEPGCWIPLLHADRLVLAGDHLQLPPTVLSDEAARAGLATSLLERLVEQYGEKITQRLETQYRMHADIMRFSSGHFYDDSLVADPTVEKHVLGGLPDIAASPLTETPVTFIDTAGADFTEEVEPGGDSKRNLPEGAFVLWKVQQLIDAGLHPRDIAVIAPYSAHVRWLRQEPRFQKARNRHRRRFSGARKRGGHHFVRAFKSKRRHRVSGRHPPHERRPHPRPPQADRRRRQLDPRPPQFLFRNAYVF